MRRIACILIAALMLGGCGGFSLFTLPESSPASTSMMGMSTPVVKPPTATVPTIEVPPDIEKPQIKSEVLLVNGKYYIAYSVSDGMKLLKYMIEQDGLIDKLRYRIKLQNELMQK